MAAGCSALFASTALAAPTHCLTLYGQCKYPKNFTHFDYVNPDAPKGGTVRMAETGTFDSLNPFILKGVKAPAIQGLYDSLMVASFDEPQSYYPLIAKKVDVAADASSASFTLNPNARWHDGTPITPEDVLFSLARFKEEADPAYRIYYTPLSRAEITGTHKVTFYFNEKGNRELPLVAAAMPILPKHYYDTVTFDGTTLTPPLGSGPYRINTVDAGRSLAYERVEDYWAKELPAIKGQYNFDRIQYEMYRDENVTLEAFKSNAYDFRQEYIARNWAMAYDSPALRQGKFIKTLIPSRIPQGMQGFIFNTRQVKFSDRRVREAIGLTMDFEWMNRTLFYDAYTRNRSYFQNTPFAATGLPDAGELTIVTPHRKHLPDSFFTEEYQIPETDGSGNARAMLIKAQNLLEEAGYVLKEGIRVDSRTSKPLTINFLLRQPTMERVIGAMRRNLKRLGIATTIRYVDDAQYQKRVEGFDFDIISVWLNRGIFFPGNEQMALWHSAQAMVKGGNNIAGVSHPAVDAALAALTSAKNLDELTTAGRALDRVLQWEHMIIPHWHSSGFRVAYWDKFGRPETQPPYNLAFQTWWVKK